MVQKSWMSCVEAGVDAPTWVSTMPVTEYWAMRHIRWLPVRDMPPLSFVLVWRTDAENDAIRALAAIVRDLGPLDLGHR
jgi:hypothetical protein